jgi:hypothetical protein
MADFMSITKIKIFAHIYICASGLFSEHDAKDTEELIDFGHNCMATLIAARKEWKLDGSSMCGKENMFQSQTNA